MPTLKVTFELQAFRFNKPPLTDAEFLEPLAIQTEDAEEAKSHEEPWARTFVRIATVQSDSPISDQDFDSWIANPCAKVARFFNSRSAETFERVRASGLDDFRLCADVIYTGDFPIVDWPEELYLAVGNYGIGLVSSWEQLEKME